MYFIGEDYIGDLSLKEAVERASEGEICIIYCGEGIGYYQGEQEKGAPPRFMLLKEKCCCGLYCSWRYAGCCPDLC